MKIRSIQQMFRTAGLTLSRFPVTILAAAGGSVIGIMIPRFSQSANESRLWLLLMMFAIAIPVSFALTTFAERRKLAPSWRILSVLFVVVLSLLFYPKLCIRSDCKERTICITWDYPDVVNHLEGGMKWNPKGLIYFIVYSLKDFK